MLSTVSDFTVRPEPDETTSHSTKPASGQVAGYPEGRGGNGSLPPPGEGVGMREDIFDNRLIFGDNLLALKALKAEFAGKVKCVFIAVRAEPLSNAS